MQDAEVGEVVKRAHETMGKLERMADASNRNTTRVEINAGGVGVWIATTACCVMLGISVLLGLAVVDLSRKVSELENYVHAIYMMAPSLKPEDLK